ncbi:MAG: hypothetical protein WCD89_06455 [Anaerocolumna sp.]
MKNILTQSCVIAYVNVKTNVSNILQKTKATYGFDLEFMYWKGSLMGAFF